MLRKRTGLVGLLAAIALFAPVARADAAGLGIQDDSSLVFEEGRVLDRAAQINAGWMRFTIIQPAWATQSDSYLRAVRAAKARGLRIMVSLMAWKDSPTPAAWGRFTRRVVSRLAAYVDAWSLMNEPNWPGLGPAIRRVCQTVPAGAIATVNRWVNRRIVHRKRVRRGHWKRVVKHRRRHGRHHGRRRVVRYRHVKHGRYRRVVRHRHGRRIVRFKRTRGWRIIRHVKHRRELARVSVHVAHQRQVCGRESYGAAYRRLYDACAPIVRALDPGAKIVAGDVAPRDAAGFMADFYRPGQPTVRPDALGIHPYLWTNPRLVNHSADWRVSSVEDAAAFARAHGVALWVTEWAEWPSAPASWWTTALERMRRAGVALTMIYDVRGHGWNTQMTDEALALAAAWAR